MASSACAGSPALYPAGHPAIVQKLDEIDDSVQSAPGAQAALHIDVIHGDVHLDGVSFRQDNETQAQVVRELPISASTASTSAAASHATSCTRCRSSSGSCKEGGATGEPMEAQLARRGIHHVSLGRLVPLDTRWKSQQWPDAPTGPIDPDYAESLVLTERTFDDVTTR